MLLISLNQKNSCKIFLSKKSFYFFAIYQDRRDKSDLTAGLKPPRKENCHKHLYISQKTQSKSRT